MRLLRLECLPWELGFAECEGEAPSNEWPFFFFFFLLAFPCLQLLTVSLLSCSPSLAAGIPGFVCGQGRGSLPGGVNLPLGLGGGRHSGEAVRLAASGQPAVTL